MIGMNLVEAAVPVDADRDGLPVVGGQPDVQLGHSQRDARQGSGLRLLLHAAAAVLGSGDADERRRGEFDVR